ncbi:hypothetical protein FOZ61_001593 [Perkinsus olseni]|uniref:EGF-like domain-containing protein n=1 Tax=Perkinsus olseni TaxID=32597 RepID=A0A7J6MFD9_PEROL|nr:hypothetical protein FOZ61_001593 [Perkinsus olseni]
MYLVNHRYYSCRGLAYENISATYAVSERGSCADTCSSEMALVNHICTRPQKLYETTSVLEIDVLQQYQPEWCRDPIELERSLADLQVKLAVTFGIPVGEVRAAIHMVDGNPTRSIHGDLTCGSTGETLPTLEREIAYFSQTDRRQLRSGGTGVNVKSHASSVKAVDLGRKPGVDPVTGNVSFASLPESYCPTEARYGSYSSLAHATAECAEDSACSGVYDLDCDGEGPFFKCRLGSIAEGSSSASCVHIKGYSSRMDLAPCVNCEQCGIQRARLSGTTGYGCLAACQRDSSCGAVSIRLSDGACFSTSSPDFTTCTNERSDYIAFLKVTSPSSLRTVKPTLSPAAECSGAIDSASDYDETTYWDVDVTVGTHCTAWVDLGRPTITSEVFVAIAASDVAAIGATLDVTPCPTLSRCSAERTFSCPLSSHSVASWQGASTAIVTCSLRTQGAPVAYRHYQMKFSSGIQVHEVSLRTIDSPQPLAVTSVSTGSDHVCVTLGGAPDVEGGLKCWGRSDDLQAGGPVGEGWSKSSATGDQLPLLATGVRQVVTGLVTDCILTAERQVRCWGSNKDGALGLGMSYLSRGLEEASPVALGTSGLSVEQIAGAYYHFCAVLDDALGRDLVKCWGFNNYGQLGLGDVLSRGKHHSHMGDNLPPAALISRQVADICTGMTFTCVLGTEGVLECAGYIPGVYENNAYQTVPPLPASGVTHMCCGRDFICALHDENQLSCAGSDANGQLGAAASSDTNIFTSTLPDEVTTAELTCGEANACLTDVTGRIFCWGDSGESRAGLGTGSVGTERPVELDLTHTDGGFFLTAHHAFNRAWRAVGACGVLWYTDDSCMDEIKPLYSTPIDSCEAYTMAVFPDAATVRCFRVVGDGPSSGWVGIERFDGLKSTPVHEVAVALPEDSFRVNPLPNRVSNYENLCDPEGSGWSSVECSSGTCHYGQCVCHRGFEGSDCSSLNIRVPATPSPQAPSGGPDAASDGCGAETSCGDHGTCQSVGGSQVCVCDEGVIGANCERECGIDPYVHRDCLERAGTPVDASLARPASPANVTTCECDEDWTFRGARCSTRSNRGCCKFSEDPADRPWCKCKGVAVWHDDFFEADTWQFCGIGWKCWPNSGVSDNNHESRTLPSLDECKLFCLNFGACENIEYDSRTGLCNLSVMKKEITGWNNGDESDFILCEPVSDLCHAVDCGLHGRCTVEDGGRVGCECTDGYSGAWCDVPPPDDPCQFRRCPEHGMCAVAAAAASGTVGLSREEWILAVTTCTCDVGWEDGSPAEAQCSRHIHLDVTVVVGIPVVGAITKMAAAVTLLRSITLALQSAAPFLRLKLNDVDAITNGPTIVTLTVLAPPDDGYYSEEMVNLIDAALSDASGFLRTQSPLAGITDQHSGRFTLDMVSAVPVSMATASIATKHILLSIVVQTDRLTANEMALVLRSKGGIAAVLATNAGDTVIKERYSSRSARSSPEFTIVESEGFLSSASPVVSASTITVAPVWWEAQEQQGNVTTDGPEVSPGETSSLLPILACAVSGFVLVVAVGGIWLWKRDRAKRLASIVAEEDPIVFARGSTVRSKPQVYPSEAPDSGKASTPVTPEGGTAGSPFDNTASEKDVKALCRGGAKQLLTEPQQPAQNRGCSGIQAESTNAGRESMGMPPFVRPHGGEGGPSRPEQRKSHMWSVDDGTGDLAIPDTINPKRRPSLIAPGKDPVAEVKEDILEWTHCHLDAVDVDARRKAFRQLQALWHPDKFDDDPSKAAVTVVFQYLQSLKQMFTSDKE